MYEITINLAHGNDEAVVTFLHELIHQSYMTSSLSHTDPSYRRVEEIIEKEAQRFYREAQPFCDTVLKLYLLEILKASHVQIVPLSENLKTF